MLLSVRAFVSTYLFALNVLAFLGVGADKLGTKWEPKKSWFDRIVPQIVQFWISADGGVPGVALGMLVFRHRIGGRRFMKALLVAAIISILHTTLVACAYSQLFVIDASFIR